MPVTDSRVRRGSLTFTVGGTEVDFSCQPTSVSITPEFGGEDDAVEVLCGDSLGSTAGNQTNSLEFTAIQDFVDPEGLVAWSWDHSLEIVEFAWTPNPEGPTYSGQVQVQALTIGGEVGSRVTSDATWPITGAVTRTPPPESP